MRIFLLALIVFCFATPVCAAEGDPLLAGIVGDGSALFDVPTATVSQYAEKVYTTGSELLTVEQT